MGITIPDDFRSHREAWRNAILAAREASAQADDDVSYWDHELKAFDRAHEELAEMDSKASEIPGADTDLAGLEKWLLAQNATAWSVVDDFPHGPCGLQSPLNDDGSSPELVATLDQEDSGYGPALWRYGLAVLAERQQAAG